MTDDDGNLAAALGEIRERHAIIDEPCGDLAVVVGRFKHSTDDVPRLLAALDEVLKLADKGGTGVPPARIRKAISRALLGEESGNA